MQLNNDYKVIIIPQIILVQLFGFLYFSKICLLRTLINQCETDEIRYAFSMVRKMNWVVFIIRYRFADSTDSRGLIMIPLS